MEKSKKYAVRVLIKKEGYKSKSLKGIVVAENPAKAKQKVILDFLQAHNKVSKIQLDESNISVKQCAVWNDFVFRN